MKNKKNLIGIIETKKSYDCALCDELAVYVRKTQFAGDHYFCKEHAEQETNFLKGDSSYYFWAKLKYSK